MCVLHHKLFKQMLLECCVEQPVQLELRPALLRRCSLNHHNHPRWRGRMLMAMRSARERQKFAIYLNCGSLSLKHLLHRPLEASGLGGSGLLT